MKFYTINNFYSTTVIRQIMQWSNSPAFRSNKSTFYHAFFFFFLNLGVFLDLRKAFDTADHENLKRKLSI